MSAIEGLDIRVPGNIITPIAQYPQIHYMNIVFEPETVVYMADDEVVIIGPANVGINHTLGILSLGIRVWDIFDAVVTIRMGITTQDVDVKIIRRHITYNIKLTNRTPDLDEVVNEIVYAYSS